MSDRSSRACASRSASIRIRSRRFTVAVMPRVSRSNEELHPSKAPTSEPDGMSTERSAFVLRVRPDKIDEYIQAHRNVWPELLAALRDAGIRNYTIFRNGNEVFGYFESDDL